MGKHARLKRERKAALQSAGLKKLPRGELIGTLDELTDHIEKFIRRLEQQVRHRINLDIANPPSLKRTSEDSNPTGITDREIKLISTGVSCGSCTKTKGCCHLAISANLFEVLPIVRRLRGDGRNTPELIEQLWDVGTEMEDTAQEEWFDKRRPCVFLSENEKCTIYGVRPTACRHHVVFTPPEQCSNFGAENDPRTRTLQYSSEPELMQCLLWNRSLCKTYFRLPDVDETMYAGSFPKLLARVLKAFNTDDWRADLAEQDWPTLSNPPNMR